MVCVVCFSIRCEALDSQTKRMVCPYPFTLIFLPTKSLKCFRNPIIGHASNFTNALLLNYPCNIQSILTAKNFKVTQKSKGPIDHHPQTWPLPQGTP